MIPDSGAHAMSEAKRDDNWLPACFSENRLKFPLEELDRYAGMYVAWSWDGTRIVASAPSDDELEAVLKQQGHNPARVVVDYIDPPGAVYAE
jgi:hypothetical protein